jgi:hypothetical protein
MGNGGSAAVSTELITAPTLHAAGHESISISTGVLTGLSGIPPFL